MLFRSRRVTSYVTIGELVTDRPDRAKLLDRFGFDYRFAGQKSLSQACDERGLDVRMVVSIVELFDDRADSAGRDGAGVATADDDDVDWSKATLAELADHIEHTHHAYLKDELPRLALLLNKVAGKYGDRDRRLIELRRVFATFKAEVDLHMAKEERIVFPACRQLSAARCPTDYHSGPLTGGVETLSAEHEEAGAAMRRMRALTDDFSPPPEGACQTYRTLLDGLAGLDEDVRRHVHKEAAILFPAALAAERRLRSLRHVYLTI